MSSPPPVFWYRQPFWQQFAAYVPDRGAPDESLYRLVEEEDLNGALAELRSTDETEDEHLGVCCVPLVHLQPEDC